MEFYETNVTDYSFRLGDIVKGLPFIKVNVVNPNIIDSKPRNLTFEYEVPQFSVIMTPCCSIEDENIIAAPLRQIPTSQFKIYPDVLDDFTKLNKQIKKKYIIPREAYKNFSEEDLEQEAWAFINNFYFDSNDILPLYEAKWKGRTINSQNYYVDFKEIQVINSSFYDRKRMREIIDLKLLELTRGRRSELRDKINEFYGRIPQEDLE